MTDGIRAIRTVLREAPEGALDVLLGADAAFARVDRSFAPLWLPPSTLSAALAEIRALLGPGARARIAVGLGLVRLAEAPEGYVMRLYPGTASSLS